MNKNDLLNISYPNDNEKILNFRLREKLEQYGFEKTFKTLSYTNQLLLNSCNVNENDFNYILIKNYLFFLNGNNNSFFEKLSDNDKDIIKNFNKFINNNDFEGALDIYMNNYVIHQLLCLVYMKNISKTESEKINELSEDVINDVYTKINLIKNADLSFKRNKNNNRIKTLLY